MLVELDILAIVSVVGMSLLNDRDGPWDSSMLLYHDQDPQQSGALAALDYGTEVVHLLLRPCQAAES